MTDEARAHDEFVDELPEYVMGILDGRARAELQAHLATCDTCPETVAALTVTTDSLLHVPVGAEPPVGFESRVLEQIRTLDVRPTPTRRRGVLLFAAVLIVLASTSAGWAVSRALSPSTPAASANGRVEQGELLADGHDVGHVYAYSGTPAWMFVSVASTKPLSWVDCAVVTRDGVRHDLGNFALKAGTGSWGTALPVSFSSIRRVVLTSTSGSVVATLDTSNWTTSKNYVAR